MKNHKKDNNNHPMLLKELLKLIKLFLSFIPKLIIYIKNRLRFSISFKITVFYGFVFFIFLLLSNLAVVSGFMYFFKQYTDNVQTDGNFLYVHFVQNTIEVHNYIAVIASIVIFSDLLFLFIILTIGSRMSKRLLLPVRKMTEATKRLSLQEMNTRLDISGSKDELKDLAKTFNDMLDRMQNSYEVQTRFVSDASHELRTPIAVIQGYANLLDRWGKDDKAVLEESVLAIKAEADNMKDLVEKLLFLARSDKNTQKVEMSDFKLNELIDEILKETKLIDDKHNIQCRKNVIISIFADRKLLKEALRIFIDNSIKYTPQGGFITLNSYTRNNQVIIELEDTGAGISKEDLPHIFDRFYRADKSRAKDSGGTGLGLSIAKWIILRHKGSIEVQSRLSFGTKICISLPHSKSSV